MRAGTAERFSCRKHRVPTRCVPDDLLCVFPKKKRKRRALRSRTMNPIGPFVISVVWSRGRRGGRGPAAVALPSRAGMRVVASDGAGHACLAVAAAGGLLVRRFPAAMAVCRLKRKVRRPADIRISRFVVRMRSAGSALYFGMSCLHGMCVGRLHAVGRVVPMRSFFRNPFRMAFSKRFYGDAAWKGKEGAIA